MLNKSNNQRQEKLLLLNRLALEMSKESIEEFSTPVLQRQEDINYFQNLLQVSFNDFDVSENN
jgi:hypothetical protein